MSYHMSPPKPALTAPAPYSPYQSTASPINQSPYAPPPAKRPRLSPDPRSPSNGSPAYAASPQGLPGAGGYGNPYGVQSPYSPSSYAGSPQSAFNTPQPYQQMPWQAPSYQHQQQRPSQPGPGDWRGGEQNTSSQMMPPPPRPNKEDKDERVGIEDIGDTLFGSGINLKDEENYLHNVWNNRHVNNDSFLSTQSTSFGSSTISPNNSFNLLTQGTSFGSQAQDGAFAGTMGRVRSQEEIENEIKRKRELAARRKADREQHHLNNQFLLGNCLRNRMHSRATEAAVRLDVQGVYLRNPEPQTHTQVMVNGDSSEGIVKVKPESMIEAGAAYEHILSLISLSAQERLRGLVGEAYGLARARQYGDHGRVVPPEFADIATGEGKQSHESVMPESVTGTQWDGLQDAAPETVNGETATPQPVQTISFEGSLNVHLRELAERDKKAERERQKRREARKRKAEDDGADGASPADTAETPTTTAPLDTAPVKLTKKAQMKRNKEAASNESQAQTQVNQTAAMMAHGKKTARYSWMSGASSQLPTNRFAKPTPGSGGVATPKAQSDLAAGQTVVKKAAEGKAPPTWGDYRENDDVHGKGIQLRDWVSVLDRDGKEKRALHKAVMHLS